eukprot:TRINITY_DN82850_c0_g1_i1.p1 TRINITY_DN82850_c0_g1~~TRINITY_DN82850_c0_g1_i1.p1  ORF type:complete len:524 (+),score=143.46 TRINITY_DN82850_c0_g1_i1:87-1658(+)
MPIQRRGTPPSSKFTAQKSVLGSLSAWTDQDDPEEEEAPLKAAGYKLLPGQAGGEEGAEQPAGTVQPVQPPQTLLQRFCPDVESDSFNLGIGVVILANAAVIGLETDYGRENFAICEHFFMAVFFTEMILKIIQLKKDYFFSYGNLFDAFLVLCGSLDLWFVPAFSALSGDAPKSGQRTGSVVGYQLSIMRLMRVLRLIRVLRVIRLFRMFRYLYLILQAFAKALQIVMLISLIIIIIDFVCAIVLKQVLGQLSGSFSDDDLAQLDEWFGTIPRSMHTLFVIMTLSDWEKIMVVLMKAIPPPIVILCFIGYIMTTSYTMASLITGIISESLITSQQEYKRKKLSGMDKKRKQIMSELREFMRDIHEDNLDSLGCVSADDLKTSVRGDTELINKLADIGVAISESGLLSLVDRLSRDGKEHVNVEYFVDKLCNLTGTASMSSLVDVRYDVIRTQKAVAKIVEKVNVLSQKLCPEDTTPEPKQEEEMVMKSYSAPTGKRSSLRVQGVAKDPAKAAKRGKIGFAEE